MDIATWSTAVEVVVTARHHHASSSWVDNAEWIPLLFLLAGPVFYLYQYARYRNRDKRHHHERETLSEIANVGTIDQYLGSQHGCRHSKMSGANQREVRG